jgi:hypothetical protein
VGIHAAGLIGAVSALVTLQTLEAAIVLVAVGRRLGFVASDLRHLRPALKTALATVAAALTAFVVKLTLAQTYMPVNMIICGAVFGVVYVFAAYALGAVTDAEKTEFRATLSRFMSRGSRVRQKLGATGATGD